MKQVKEYSEAFVVEMVRNANLRKKTVDIDRYKATLLKRQVKME